MRKYVVAAWVVTLLGMGSAVAQPASGKSWERGEYFDVPQAQWTVVNDWNLYSELQPPPVGCEWVRSGGEYLLVETATGFIRTVIGGPT